MNAVAILVALLVAGCAPVVGGALCAGAVGRYLLHTETVEVGVEPGRVAIAARVAF